LSQCFDDKRKFALRELLTLRTAELEFGESSVIGRTDSDDSFDRLPLVIVGAVSAGRLEESEDPQILPMEINRSGVQGKVC
jgi:hypothetical protein